MNVFFQLPTPRPLACLSPWLLPSTPPWSPFWWKRSQQSSIIFTVRFWGYGPSQCLSLFPQCCTGSRRNFRCIILTKFSSLVTLEVVILTTFGGTGGENWAKITIFPSQPWLLVVVILDATAFRYAALQNVCVFRHQWGWSHRPPGNRRFQEGKTNSVWWRPDMKTFSALLTLCEGNPSVTGRFPSQRASDAKLSYFLWCTSEYTPKQTMELSVVWNTRAPIVTLQ